jgi:hypothetical protein
LITVGRTGPSMPTSLTILRATVLHELCAMMLPTNGSRTTVPEAELPV